MKKLNLQFIKCGEGLVENVIICEGRWLAENVRISSYGGGGLKLLKKPSYDI